MRVRVYPLALGKMIKHTLDDLSKEVAGLLVGKYLKKGDVLEIWDTVTGEQKSTPGFVYLEEETIAAAAEWVLRNRPGLYIVGWYHSHPGFDVFLSAIDIQTQKLYQRLFPKAVALVIDPLKYAKTKRLQDLNFKVFRINPKGEVTMIPVSIGIQRQKLLESTLKGIETMELKYISGVGGRAGQERFEDFEADLGFPADKLTDIIRHHVQRRLKLVWRRARS
jgi:proteasome lid subunit RPN8/RPN11